MSRRPGGPNSGGPLRRDLQAVRPGRGQPIREFRRPGRLDPRCGRRERRRQIDSDEHPLRLLSAGSRHYPARGRAGPDRRFGAGDKTRHRHGPSAFRPGRRFHRAPEHHARARRRLPARSRPGGGPPASGGTRSRLRAGRRSRCGRRDSPGRAAPAGRDPQSALSRRPDPDPRRADCRADPGRDRAALRHPPAPAGRGQDDLPDHPQAAGDHGGDRSGDRAPPGQRRGRSGDIGDERGGTGRIHDRPQAGGASGGDARPARPGQARRHRAGGGRSERDPAARRRRPDAAGRRNRRGRRQRPERAAGGPGRAGPGRRLAPPGRTGSAALRPRPGAAAIGSRPYSRGPATHGSDRRFRGLGERDPGPSARAPLCAARVPAARLRGRRDPGADGRVRNPAERSASAQRRLLRRQSAEADRGAGDGAGTRSAARRPADPRRRYRCDRTDPRPAASAPGWRDGDPARLFRTGRNPGPLRPDSGHGRRADHRLVRAGGGERTGDRLDDGRARGGERMTGRALPPFLDYAVIPLLNLLAALIVSGLILAAIGVPPGTALASMAEGAFGSADGIGYTLYYATNFIFAGLAVALPARAGLFNIGGEGQAMIGGLLVALVCLGLPGWPWWAALPLAAAAALFGGAAWALIPALLQVRRGSHIVITTILFNFLASKFSTWMLVDVVRAPGDPSPETAGFDPSLALPAAAGSPVNLSLLLALAAAFLAWLLVHRTVWGYELRAAGQSPEAAHYAAIPAGTLAVVAICLGGACAGMIGVNEAMGVEHRLVLGFTAGAGFVGVAVALMGRNHAFGIVLAAILFGALYQGGAELSFDYPQATRDIVVVMDGLVILFCGALEQLWRRPVAALWLRS